MHPETETGLAGQATSGDSTDVPVSKEAPQEQEDDGSEEDAGGGEDSGESDA